MELVKKPVFEKAESIVKGFPVINIDRAGFKCFFVLLNFPGNIQEIGEGSMGVAFLVGNQVFKLTRDKSEFVNANKILGKELVPFSYDNTFSCRSEFLRTNLFSSISLMYFKIEFINKFDRYSIFASL